MQPSRHNHYVPKWYQKGFICGTRSTIYYLDLDPPTRELPGGRTILGNAHRLRPPKRCFQEKDLYTTWFGCMLNDDIERHLFGSIDTIGAAAVRAFISNNAQDIHRYFQRFFEYLDAQKLRTPKGLDWIKTKYPNLTQLDLMMEMQHLRQMHCTMWGECVREIVSAKESNVKFIVTDHPVTTYNPTYIPESTVCQYPNDPLTALNGTQTVFALDAEHCLILTNLEYAKDPTKVDLRAPRQNVRYLGSSLVRTDAIIRTRSLSRDEVISINLLLKARSRQYLAAYEPEWLFPEKAATVAWEEIGKILLPPRDGLGDFGGEVFICYNDGTTEYRDAFGRSEPNHQFLKKKTQQTAPGPNDSCSCGSGLRFKKCCRDIAENDRPPWNVYSIRDRNRMFCNKVVDILSLNQNKTWEDVRRELSGDQVKRIHEILEMLWPTDTNIADLLPRPNRRAFRAVYMGLIDPRTIAESVISSLAYFDEIFVLNPFQNPRHMSPEYSPTHSPVQHKSQLLKNVRVLFALRPFIDVGIVHLVPDPMGFNSDFRCELMAMVGERTATWNPKAKETELFRALIEDDLQRKMLRLPDNQLKLWIRESLPNIDPERLEAVVARRKANLVHDPLALLQPLLPNGPQGGCLQVFRSMNLELALFVAQLTGAAIYTDQQVYWRQLLEHTSAASAGQRSGWEPLVAKMARLSFPIELNGAINLKIRETAKLCRMRRLFRHFWNTALPPCDDAEDHRITQQLAIRLENAYIQSGLEWNQCNTTMGPSRRLRRRIELSVPRAGFDLNSVHRLLVISGRTTHLESVPIALLLTTIGDAGQVSPQ